VKGLADTSGVLGIHAELSGASLGWKYGGANRKVLRPKPLAS
jgi:hypothetical protein